ncbi:hypothetical protein ACTMP8_23815, partial [Escherichia coli]|uniref:hypothetical protein n=1 Tax=Escherichia coli TaxID=562 RepID=UPI003F8C8948
RQKRHAVYTGQAEIKNDEFVAVLRQRLFGKNAVVNHIDGEAGLFQAALNSARDRAVIFDEKESHRIRSSTKYNRLRFRLATDTANDAAIMKFGGPKLPANQC